MEVHKHEAGGVPELVGEVAARLDLLIREAHIVAGRVVRRERETQRVRAVLLDDLQRVDAVAQRLRHLPALRVAHEPVDEDGAEGRLAGVLDAGEYHPRDPEEDDVVSRDERGRRVEIIEVGGLLRPAERRERPERRGEPCIEDVFVLAHILRAALRADADVFLGNDHLAAVGAVIRGYAVSPPELAGDAPVVDVVHPVDVYLREALGHELNLAAFDRFDGGLCERSHLHEPLAGGDGLDRRLAAVAFADVVDVVLDLDEAALLLKVRDDLLAGGVSVESEVAAAVLVDAGVLVHYEDLFKPVALADLEVVRVVAGRDLHAAGAELHIDVFVRDDRDLPADERKHGGLADDILIAFVRGVDGNRGIAEHRLRTRRCDDERLRRALDGVSDVPEVAGLLLILDLRVGKRGRAARAPVDYAVASVDEPLVVEVDEDLLDRLGTALVHREALPAPVAGRAELAELLEDAAAVKLLPVPDAADEALSAEVVARFALVVAQVGFDDYLRGDAGVVGARYPQRGIALHTARADKYILHRFVEGVSHMELAGHVRWRNDDGVRLLRGVDLRGEAVALQPEVVYAVLHLAGVVGFFELFSHKFSRTFRIKTDARTRLHVYLLEIISQTDCYVKKIRAVLLEKFANRAII